MALPVNEVSVTISLILVVIWAYVKFISHKHRPHSEDMVDLIALLLLVPVLVIGAIFIAVALGVVELTSIEGLFIHMGISGGILIGAVIYFFYITLHREDGLADKRSHAVASGLQRASLKLKPGRR